MGELVGQQLLHESAAEGHQVVGRDRSADGYSHRAKLAGIERGETTGR
jgi:hypothetical protein